MTGKSLDSQSLHSRCTTSRVPVPVCMRLLSAQNARCLLKGCMIKLLRKAWARCLSSEGSEGLSCTQDKMEALLLDHRMRLVLLFSLRYERDGQAQIGDLLQRLQDYGLPRAQLGLARTLLAHAGADKRVGDLFSNRSFSSRFATMAKHSLRVGLPTLQTAVFLFCVGLHFIHVSG